MKITYPFDNTAPAGNIGAAAITARKNAVMQFNIADSSFTIEAKDTTETEVPAKLLSVPTLKSTGVTLVAGGLGPHEDYRFCRYSAELTYMTKALVDGDLVVKTMSVGAIAGDIGRMTLYKDAASLDADETGVWSARLVREIVLNATDIATRDAGWPASGAIPTIDADTKRVKDNGGDGFNHI